MKLFATVTSSMRDCHPLCNKANCFFSSLPWKHVLKISCISQNHTISFIRFPHKSCTRETWKSFSCFAHFSFTMTAATGCIQGPSLSDNCSTKDTRGNKERMRNSQQSSLPCYCVTLSPYSFPCHVFMRGTFLVPNFCATLAEVV